jgi:hypothetical protein
MARMEPIPAPISWRLDDCGRMNGEDCNVWPDAFASGEHCLYSDMVSPTGES